MTEPLAMPMSLATLLTFAKESQTVDERQSNRRQDISTILEFAKLPDICRDSLDPGERRSV